MGKVVSMPGNQGPTRFQPLYYQVKEHLIQRIVEGTWLPGTALPSESQLAVELGVSQGTVRKALDEMTAEKLVVRRQGRGTFVAEHTQEQALFHFFRLADSDGVAPIPSSEVVSLSERSATDYEISKLGLSVGGLVSEIVRVRRLEGEPVVLEEIVLALADFPGIASENALPNTLYTLYQRRYGFSVLKAKESIRAVLASDKDALLLGVESGSALLQIERVAYSIDGRPIELRYSRCVTEHYTYQVELT